MADNTEQNEKQNGHGQMVTDQTAFSEQENMNKNVVPEKCAATEIKENKFYGVEDVPPPHLCFLFGLQQALLCLGGSLNVPFILAELLCVVNKAEVTSELLSITMFMTGTATIVQTTFGVRLGIVQGASHIFIAPVIAMMASTKCPEPEEISALLQGNSSETAIKELWQYRMREVQGGMVLASLFQLVIGSFGLVGLLMRFIGPLTIAPTISLIGLSLTHSATNFNQVHWGLAILTMVLIAIFSLFLGRINMPCISYTTEQKCHTTKIPIFSLLSVILSIGITWIVSYALTITDVIPNNVTDPSYYARTDAKLDVLESMPWFYFPYPCQFGMPTVTIAGFIGMLASTIASTIESIGDYYACARMSRAPPPPPHAINRGIAVEGLCSIFSSLVGAGHPTTSYSGNIGAIGITKVASRRVFQVCGIILLIGGIIGKFGAILTLIPTPIIGGTLTVLFGMVAAVGISVLQFIDLSSIRNLTILGFSFILGLSIPEWISEHPDKINTGYVELDDVIRVLLGTSMFVGGIIGFILDNIVPGTAEERGILKWRENLQSESTFDVASVEDVYGLSFITKHLKKIKCCSYVPVSPTFDHEGCLNCRKRQSGNLSCGQNNFSNVGYDGGI